MPKQIILGNIIFCFILHSFFYISTGLHCSEMENVSKFEKCDHFPKSHISQIRISRQSLEVQLPRNVGSVRFSRKGVMPKSEQRGNVPKKLRLLLFRDCDFLRNCLMFQISKLLFFDTVQSRRYASTDCI